MRNQHKESFSVMLSEKIILILDTREFSPANEPEKAGIHWNIAQQASNVRIINTDKLENTSELIEKYEPDIILLYDNFDKNVKEICTEIREKNTLQRPVLVVISGEKSLDNRLDIIKSGADDLQSINSKDEELSVRVFAHLRRQTEENSDSITRLPLANTIYKVIKRNIIKENKEIIAVMYLSIDNFASYKEIYGHIATEKLIKTLIAIIKTALSENDFLGQHSENGFVLVTSPEKAEKIATFLSYSFDNVAPKFYSQEDYERGYLLLTGDDKIGRRIPFVSISIGISSNRYNNFNSYLDAFNTSKHFQRMAKSRTASCWLSDRPKISGKTAPKKTEMRILISETDDALSYLLATTLEMQGYNVEKIFDVNDIQLNIDENKNNLIIIDIPNESSSQELNVCRVLKQKYPDIKIIMSTVNRNKERVLDAGADLYIPKPYELMTLFSWIEKFLNEDAI